MANSSAIRSVTAQLRGAISIFAMALNTFICVIPLYVLAILKLLIPISAIQKLLQRGLMSVAELWIGVNNAILASYRNMDWQTVAQPDLSYQSSYLVNCNHQSWVDILVLQHCFNREIPFMRFFIKQQLLWVPLLGLAWWALDFPFMRRYSKEQLASNPDLKGKDLETTRKFCERMSEVPLSIMNFVEGTRFTEQKHQSQQSEYQYLLKPKAGGMAVALSTLQQKMKRLLDVTIVYPSGRPTLWSMLCGHLDKAIIHIQEISVPDHLLGQQLDDQQYRKELQQWINQRWQQKDQLIGELSKQQE